MKRLSGQNRFGRAVVFYVVLPFLGEPGAPCANAKNPAPSPDGKDGNWYFTDQEKQVGAKMSAVLKQSLPLLHDAGTDAYRTKGKGTAFAAPNRQPLTGHPDPSS